MDRRFKSGLEEMLSQAQISSETVDGLLQRLDLFIVPFATTLTEPEQRRHTTEYVTGLLSKLKHKTAEGIAYLHDQERQGIQTFIGLAPWDHQPMLTILACQVGQELGEEDGVIVFDPSAFAKKGTKSVGVARQWCGRLGKIENCQVGVYMAYASSKEHALVNMRLYLPEE
jgi:SRSO17 transposase